MEQQTKPPKYGNAKTVVNGLKFDSRAEAQRYSHLMILQRAGHISNLRCQVSFELVSGVKFAGAARAKPSLRYVADFVYTEKGKEVIEDVKGVETQEFKIKRHLMLALLGKEVQVLK